ncbi:mannose-1-phosphate guanylyltransferase/mannose-6-phosphate isomerase [Methylotenera mobilis]|uniref:mannose-1-phosphate guanylyltransferase n=1 Tax=Methylotenera mobilis (strain JLW8 / ATCC BAA-1282 / DSM 17540) TaxID=583345 RepID=C6WVI4_METML|nr:mannose-1-phosphate guanylyltransferase/mannose-6-phosphate isomerase [Methylotenera mobilis]ACT47933.1 mannose-1-phosphate guanylyltransferase/mannose-6-phosphate isomerase [Methylotenera mobilis JLW8]
MNKTPINITPVILCGGSGTRLWPLSRTGFPKQFLVLSGTNSLFQQATNRLSQLSAADIAVGETLIVTNEAHRFLVLDQLRELSQVSASLLLEPVGRNTAPALTLAALQAVANGDDPILVVTPADQTVQNEEAFTTTLQNSIRVATTGAIVILGIQPNKPETGFGYIRREGAAGLHNEYNVAQFAEKPDYETAQAYFASGDYTWNSGMFVVRASVWLKALQHFRLDIFESTSNSFVNSVRDNLFVRPDAALFANVASESVDYAVMEKCPGSKFQIKMVPLDAGWNDLGAWDAVWQVGEQDANGNVSNGDTIIENTNNTLINASHRLVSTVGVSNLVIVETADAVLVADRSMSQGVKKIVSQLELQKREERVLHRKVSRPWGWYDTIDVGERFKVKRIQVSPGASLSLQKHTKRAEHWVVVTGTAEVTCGDKVITLHENESTYIPLGETHRLANAGAVPLEIVEVQSGSYLGEDDIIRFEDTYGRIEEGKA